MSELVKDSSPTFKGQNGLTLEAMFRINEVAYDLQDRLIGSVMEKIEMLGLPEKQEKATKESVKKEVYRFHGELYETLEVYLDEQGKERLAHDHAKGQSVPNSI